MTEPAPPDQRPTPEQCRARLVEAYRGVWPSEAEMPFGLGKLRLETNASLLRWREPGPAEAELAAAIQETLKAGHATWFCAQCVRMHSEQEGCVGRAL